MKVFITRKIPSLGLKLLNNSGIEFDIFESDNAIPRTELLEALNNTKYDAILTTLSDNIDDEVLDIAGKQLKIVANFAVGYGNIDVDACSNRSIAVSNTPDVLSAATADMAFALLLATARRIVEGHQLIIKDEWTGWAPTQLLGQDLNNKTLGIVGMGRIGEEMAKRALGFGMKIIYHNRNQKPLAEKELNVKYVSLAELLSQSDFISLHMPLTAQTRYMIAKKEFDLMKPNCIIVNTARGPVINENDLVKALKQGHIWGAGLDVFEFEPKVTEELKSMPNVVLAPHLGSATQGTRDAMIELAVNSIIAVATGKIANNILNADA